MDINICKNLKKFRKDKGNTQEELADYLNISIQAVSKWERDESYPDITLLPKIAAYYNVSVDTLLGVDKINRQNKIDEYCSMAKEYSSKGDRENQLKVWKEAMREFSNELSVVNEYMYALPDDNEKDAHEKIKMAERLINESTESEDYYNGAIQNLCYTYMTIGNIEKAKEYAKKMPGYYVTCDQLMMSLLKGEEAASYIQYNIMTLTDIIYLNVINLDREGSYTEPEKIQLYQYSLTLYELLLGEGDYKFYYDRTFDLYFRMARCYAKMADSENTFKSLELSIEHQIQCLTHPDGKYKSILTNRHSYKKGNISKKNVEWLLNEMKREIFDFCRNDERFKEAEEKLEKYK